ncbi:unnamed protein product [Pleuronectes platessa]|uniref:PRELI/MSF1 domain-containing protein n=1 Tax=Pleuronectes platessa TaxID=8262 RepID=A0A9N7UGB6_PLEPL|nr:unnamed protein product [Pleuronectes platessa]
MVKYFSCAGLLQSSWDQVCIAFWQRYPNPYSNHVLTEDIIFREVTPSNCLISRRLLTKVSRAPRWMERHARLMSVEERCEYGINPDNSSWTELKREAWISSNVYGLSRAIQEFGLARFKTSVTKTMKGFEYVLARMQGETPSRTLTETATERARETALAAKEKAKDFASHAQKKQYV